MTINVENIKKVRDHIAAVDAKRVNMQVWASNKADPAQLPSDVVPTLLHDCGTCGCIGGWTEALLGRSIKGDGAVMIEEDVGELLGLDDRGAWKLFYPRDIENRTQAEAVAVLDRLIETGEVDWNWAIANPAQIGGAA